MNKLTKKELQEQKKLEKEAWETELAKKQKIKHYSLWGGLAAVLILSAGLIFFFNKPTLPDPVISTAVNNSLPPLTTEEYVSGPNSAKVTVIEYGDFQCPACGHYFPMVTKLKSDYKDTVKFVFRNFPLTGVHQNAQMAAQAAYAAGKQGKFWEMHDLLFQNQATWAESSTAMKTFGEYAQRLQLDVTKFETDMMSQAASEFIGKQYDGGQKAGVAGTPTFYINGKQITNPTTYEDFKKLVDEELK